MKKFLVVFSLGCSIFGLSSAAFAQSDDGWNWEIAPMYLWGVGLDGTMTVQGVSNEVDMGFGDILDELDFAATVHLEGNNGRVGFFVDVTAIELAPEVPLPMETGEAEVGIAVVEGAGIYRFPAGESTSFELLYGFRFMDMDVDLVLPQPIPDPALPTSIVVEGNQDWIDAMVGGRVLKQLSSKWDLVARADVSAGGSDFTWNASVLFNYDLNQKWSLALGYRHVDVDYEDGEGAELFRFNASLSGPLAGVAYTF